MIGSKIFKTCSIEATCVTSLLSTSETLGIFCLPIPHVSAHISQAPRRFPTELLESGLRYIACSSRNVYNSHLLCEVTAGEETVHVPLPPGGDHVGDLLPHHLPESLDDLQHSGPSPGAKIELVDTGPVTINSSL